MKKMPLTPKQLNVLKFIKSFYIEHEYMPTYMEICESLNMRSTSSAFHYVTSLDKKGHIKRYKEGKYGGNRAMELIAD